MGLKYEPASEPLHIPRPMSAASVLWGGDFQRTEEQPFPNTSLGARRHVHEEEAEEEADLDQVRASNVCDLGIRFTALHLYYSQA